MLELRLKAIQLCIHFENWADAYQVADSVIQLNKDRKNKGLKGITGKDKAEFF